MTSTSHSVRRSAGLLLCLFMTLTAAQSAWAKAAKPAKEKTAAVKTVKKQSSKAAKTNTKQAKASSAKANKSTKAAAKTGKKGQDKSRLADKKSSKDKAHNKVAKNSKQQPNSKAQAPVVRHADLALRARIAEAKEERLAQARETRRAQEALAGTSARELGSDEDQSASMQAFAERADISASSLSRHADARDPLGLNSSVGYVMDADTREVLYSKNEQAVLPIASITKLMTAVLIAEGRLPMDEAITITNDDVDYLKNSSSRLKVGTTLSRGQMLLLALMSSENRAAHSLGRTYPGGTYNFVRYMNQKAHDLGMRDTRYVDPTGLSSENRSSARDLATLVAYAAKDNMIRAYSTNTGYALDTGSNTMEYRNSNGLVRGGNWTIDLQKTGYIREAGRCLVMQTKIAGRNLVMVLLNAGGTAGRTDDAERIRQWVEAASGQRYMTAAASDRGGIIQASNTQQPVRGNLMQAMKVGY